MRLTNSLAAIILALSVPILVHAADDFEIKLDRPHKAGDKFSISCVGELRQSMANFTGKKEMKTAPTVNKVTLEAQVEVLESDPAQRTEKSQYTITKCIQAEGDAEHEVLAPGKVLLVSLKKGQKSIELKNGSLKPEELAAVELALPAGTTQNDDDVCGTQDRKKVGDSWQVNLAATAEELNANGIPVKQESLKGKAKLLSVKKSGNTPCLEISVELTAKDLDLPPLPAFTEKEGLLTVTLSGLYPVDTHLPRVTNFSKVVIHQIMDGKVASGPVTMDVTTEESNETTYKY